MIVLVDEAHSLTSRQQKTAAIVAETLFNGYFMSASKDGKTKEGPHVANNCTIKVMGDLWDGKFDDPCRVVRENQNKFGGRLGMMLLPTVKAVEALILKVKKDNLADCVY